MDAWVWASFGGPWAGSFTMGSSFDGNERIGFVSPLDLLPVYYMRMSLSMS